MKRYIIGALLAGLLYWFIGLNSHEKQQERVVEKEISPLVSTPKVVSKDKPNNSPKKGNTPSVYAGDDVNTTMLKEIELHATVDEPSDEYRYLWREGDENLSNDVSLHKGFSLGEHLLTFQLLKDGEPIAEDELKVRAWRYIKKETFYFDTDIDEYRLSQTKFFNHLDKLVLVFSDYYRDSFTYNQYGKVLEHKHDYFGQASNNNYTLTNSYDEEKLLAMEKVDDEGNIVESHIYDEEGKEIIVEVDLAEEKAPVEESSSSSYKKEYNEDGNVTKIVSTNGKYIRNFRYENGRVIYQDAIYQRGKNITRFQYDINGKEIYREYERQDSDGNIRSRDIVKIAYDEDGNRVERERIYTIKGTPMQHTIERWKFKEGKVMVNETEALVGVCPCSANLVKERRTYSYDDNGTKTSTNYEYQREGDDEFKKRKDAKVIMSYTDVLE